MKSLFHKIGKKLSNKKGDSIAEVLVALLISAVALVMLASMINSSASLTESSKNRMQTYYSSSVDLAERTAPSTNGTAVISEGGTEIGSYAVTYYVNPDVNGDPVVTYRYK